MIDTKDIINYMKSIPIYLFALGVALLVLHYFTHLPYLDVFSSLSLAISIIFGFAYAFVYIQKRTITDFSDSNILGIICESDLYPSLSRAQFLSWTFLIGIVFLWLLFLKIWYAILYSKELDISTLAISENLLFLMGITSFTTVTSKGLSSIKYNLDKKNPQPLGTMLQEDGKPSLTRYQMFLWTSISILTYFGLVFGAIFLNYNNILNLKLPDFPQILLALMGISQATYLGGKFASQTADSSISEITPNNQKIGETIDILGQNFGDEGGSVHFDDKRVDISKGTEWTNSRITVKIPTDIKPHDGKINVKVRSNSGSTTVPIEYKIYTIDWKNPADITYGTPLSNTQLNASASIPGTFVYTPPAETVLSAGQQVLHVDFTPTDTANYTKATADVTINVIQGTPTINWNNPADITYGTPLSNTQLNASASVPGTYDYTPPAGTLLDVGTHTLHVNLIPDDVANFNAAAKDVTINVIQATPTINWKNPADITYGTPLSNTQLNASASIPGTFVYTPPAETVLDVSTHTLHVAFTPTDTKNYTSASKTVTINVSHSKLR